ncbi:RNA polymerase sigma-70 factor [Paenibacillus alkalitolerans]|uniref:RNA polymerase sigma-70 factor n=1 Tax=Paenibacillus alkalitolerans TaxID=2799335 RepID=UPI0018F382B1|nr:RNA polymerase sigma-70 factor [Paenibacillus alkalitolerans]
MDLELLYKQYYPLLFSIAYRMLGSVADAEDLAHDVILQAEPLDADNITNMKAYLTKMAANRCLNLLKSSRKNREVYTGPWLPEPQVSLHEESPLETVVKNETISYALLVLMEQLTPVERAVFVLREAFEYEYGEIAEILEKSEANCRKIYSRVKKKLQPGVPQLSRSAEHMDRLVKKFIDASKTGNFSDFIGMLTDDAVLISDGGGKVLAAINPIVSKERVAAFLEGLASKGGFQGDIRPAFVSGQSGIVHIKDGRPDKVICFDLDESRKHVNLIYLVRNPDKLKRITVP